MHFISRIKLQVFDLDDTLVSTRQSYQDAQKTALKHLWPHKNDQELAEAFNQLDWLCKRFGSGNKELYFKAFLVTNNIYSPESLHSLIKSYNNFFWHDLRVLSFAVQYLELLKKQGCQLAIVSNGKISSQKKKLQITRLDDFFTADSCYISEQYEPQQKKPSPHMLEVACNNYQIPAVEAVYFGNTVEDVIAGNLAGMTTVFVGNKIQNEAKQIKIALPDYRIKSWQEVLP